MKEVERVYRIIGKGTEEWAEYLNPLLFFVFSIFFGGLFLIPLTLKAYPKVKLPSYEQVKLGLRQEHKPKPQNLDNKININNNKSKVKGDSLIKEWERTYDYNSYDLALGLDKDGNNNLLLGMGDNITWSYIVKVNPIDGDTINVISRVRSPPGSQTADTNIEQVLASLNNKIIMIGMDRNYSENRNNLWIGAYSAAGDSIWFNYYNRDSTSSEFFLLQKPAAVFSDGSVFIAPRSDLNMWSFCVDTLGNLKWDHDFVDTTIEKYSGAVIDVEVRNDTVWAMGGYLISSQNFGHKYYIIDKDGNVINKKYYDFSNLYKDQISATKFTPDGKLYVSGDYDASNGDGYYTPFVARIDPQTLDTLWLKTYEGGVYRDERVMDMATTSSYLFLAGYINTESDTTDTAVVWMTDTAGNYIAEYDRPQAIYTGATNIGDSLIFAYGRDEIAGKPLLVKYKIDMSGISEENKPKQVNNLELRVLNNPSKAPVIMVNGVGNIIVYNLLGQKVGSYEIKGGKTRINGLKAGVYFAVYGDNILKIEVIK